MSRPSRAEEAAASSQRGDDAPNSELAPERDAPRRPAGPRSARALVAGIVVLVAGTFLPWMRSGSNWYSSYGVARAGRTLGVAEGTIAHVLLWAWPLAPLAGAVAVLCAVLSRPRAAAAVALGLAVTTAAFVCAVLVAGVDLGVGTLVSGLASLVLGALAVPALARPGPRA